MKAPTPTNRRELTPLQACAGVAVLVIPMWLIAPHVFAQLMRSSLGLAAGMALAGLLLRRSYWDALILGVPIVAIGDNVEIGLGALLMAVPAASVFALTRRPRFAAAAGALLLGLLVIAIRLKERFAGSMLTWHDLKFFFLQFRDNVGVMASQPTLLAYSAVVLAGLGAAGWLCWRLDRAAVREASRASQVVAALLAFAVAGWSAVLLRGEISTLARDTAWVLGSLGSYERPLSGFLSTAGRAPRWAVPATDTAAFGERVRQRMAASTGAAAPADIVLFLQESQFNPATIDGCPAQLCQSDLFRASGRTVSHGPLQVHVFGGGTWLTEFAVANGVPHMAFGPAGDFAPFNVAPGVRRSFVRSLKAAGYRTVAIYPVRGGMMNARSAYAGYGFDKFVDSDELGLSGTFFTSDDDMHAAARSILAQERRHGQPVFLMVVTIFNHAEHGVRLDRIPAALLDQASASFKEEKLAQNVADYVWRTGEFARVLDATKVAVLDAGRPAVLAWFGDHQPPFGNALSLRDRIRSVRTPTGAVTARMQTWYEVSSNVTYLPPHAALQPLDVTFLPGLLAQAAGVRLDEWLAANVAAREDCGRLLLDCARPGGRDAYLSYLWKDLRQFDVP